MEDLELKVMYKQYLRQKAALDKLWNNILHELVRRAKKVGIELE